MLQTPPQPKKGRKLLSGRWAPDPFAFSGGRARMGPYSILPQAKYAGVSNFMHYCIGPGAELSEADLSDADLRWSNFRNANLKTANLNGSILWGSILTHADLSGANLAHADFTGADLVGANLSDTDCDGSCFVGARYDQSTCFPKSFGDPSKKGMISLSSSMHLSGCQQ